MQMSCRAIQSAAESLAEKKEPAEDTATTAPTKQTAVHITRRHSDAVAREINRRTRYTSRDLTSG